jgi:hypothetical protein
MIQQERAQTAAHGGRIIASQIIPPQRRTVLMRPEASDPSSFLRPFWNRCAMPPWLHAV